LWVTGQGDASTSEVDVIEGQLTDCGCAGGVDRDQSDDLPLRRGDCRVRDGGYLCAGHREQRPGRGDVTDVQPPGRIGEDQTVALGEPEQRLQRDEGARQAVPAQLVQHGCDVVLGEGSLPQARRRSQAGRAS
jgi:hypothetical protein